MALPASSSMAALPAFMQRTIKRKDESEEQGGHSKQFRVAAEAEEAAQVLAKKSGRKGGANKSDIIEQLVQVLARLVLTNSNDLRELTGMLLTTHLVPSSFPLAAQALVAGKLYQDMVQEQRKEKGKMKETEEAEDQMDMTFVSDSLGAPHVYIAMMAIQAMLNDASLVGMEA